jgi:hypothetical protein
MTLCRNSVSILLVIGIFFVSVSAVCAQQRFPTKGTPAITPHQEGGTAGIIVIDSVITDPKSADHLPSGLTRTGVAVEPGDAFQPPSPGTGIERGVHTVKPDDRFSHEDISPGRK